MSGANFRRKKLRTKKRRFDVVLVFVRCEVIGLCMLLLLSRSSVSCLADFNHKAQLESWASDLQT